MSQSRRASLVESLANIVVGILIQGAGQAGLFYVMHLDISVKQFTAFTLVMTILSIVRSYTLRRLWNAEFWKRKKKLVPAPAPAYAQKYFPDCTCVSCVQSRKVRAAERLIDIVKCTVCGERGCPDHM